ncbi:hypothetical protein GGU10DRAFT_337871 [Lentinula aff. detonsa]|uniref:Uncharacterized protein n=1 Tax=Lentinula aff. detonsa TaxID=2804958 RepID=A0AA38K7C2_9AGAR|nr:hypothetical protein GGU10DRAFT_337871 [Lentinula aff. detonsa]
MYKSISASVPVQTMCIIAAIVRTCCVWGKEHESGRAATARTNSEMLLFTSWIMFIEEIPFLLTDMRLRMAPDLCDHRQTGLAGAGWGTADEVDLYLLGKVNLYFVPSFTFCSEQESRVVQAIPKALPLPLPLPFSRAVFSIVMSSLKQYINISEAPFITVSRQSFHNRENRASLNKVEVEVEVEVELQVELLDKIEPRAFSKSSICLSKYTKDPQNEEKFSGELTISLSNNPQNEEKF